MNAADLKKALRSEGFVIYRTLGEQIALAERVRENLILDSGVRIKPTTGDGANGEPVASFEVTITFRAEKNAFPGIREAVIYTHMAQGSERATELGFKELTRGARAITDPVDPAVTLDTFYELVMVKDAVDFEEAVRLAKFALGIDRIVFPPARESMPR
ncbi:MAG: hypothetical protein U0174_06490 [Polyangiaceae bacterium]